ncbi:hypothetical protein PF008_g1769 [Phytophthora fragariae]|uniref:Uncharacterized protein n=1 Tax=Phytophthora fragariae TaxID=53985 RepID=A0A6G0SJ53_9STRA|nr:hypothetical protein PF008_g1769 [Phytophthora fragariae]
MASWTRSEHLILIAACENAFAAHPRESLVYPSTAMQAAIHKRFVELARSSRRTQRATTLKWKKLVTQFRTKDDELDADFHAAVERVLRVCEPGWSRSELNLLTQAIDTVGFPALRSVRQSCKGSLRGSVVVLGPAMPWRLRLAR